MPRDPRVVICGTGSRVPDTILTNQYFEKIVDTSDEWIMQRTGIRERRRLAPEEATSDIAVAAARRALESAMLDAKNLDGIILCTVTPDTQVPAGACYVQRDLGATRATAFDLNAACAGWVYGLVVAEGMIAAGIWRSCLVIGAEALTRILNIKDRNTCILFGDGAGAVVLSSPDHVGPASVRAGLLDSGLGSDGNRVEAIIQPAGGSRKPASHETVDECLHALTMNGREVFKFAVKKMVELTMTCCERNGLRLDQIAHFVPHQVNQRILDSVFDQLGVPIDRCVINLDRYGNTSSASVPIALDEAAREGRFQSGDLIFTTAFGAGLTWGWNLIRW